MRNEVYMFYARMGLSCMCMHVLRSRFSRLSQKLGAVLLPDATDASTSEDLMLKLVESSSCKINGSSWLPTYDGHAARKIDAVAMRGFRAPADAGGYVTQQAVCGSL